MIRHHPRCPFRAPAAPEAPAPDPAACACGKGPLELRVRNGFLWDAPPAGEITLVLWEHDRTLFNVLRKPIDQIAVWLAGRLTTRRPDARQLSTLALERDPDPWSLPGTIEFAREQPVTPARRIYDFMEVARR